MSEESSPFGMPSDGAEWLSALRRFGQLETGTDVLLEAVVHRAAILFNVPLAALSLHDETVRVFKSSIGLGVPHTAHDLATCAEGIVSKEPFFLLNARADSRFASNPVVQGPPGIRFYAGAPVYGPDGQLFGALCAMDRRERAHVEPEELVSLKTLAAEAATIFASRAIDIKPERSW